MDTPFTEQTGQEEDDESVDRLNNTLLEFKRKDLEIIKYMYANEAKPVGKVVHHLYDINTRQDMQDRYSSVEYRLQRMADLGVLDKEELDRGALYQLSQKKAFIGEFSAEMTYRGDKRDMAFDNVLFLNLDGIATFIALDNVDDI